MDVNHLKDVLVEQKHTSKWLAELLGVNPSTVSKVVYKHFITSIGNINSNSAALKC